MRPLKNNIVTEISLSYRSKIAAKDRPKISSSKDSYNILYSIWDADKLEFQEQFVMLVLNRSNHVLGKIILSSGTTAAALVDIKYIIVAACKANASAIILAHNHPSGNMQPSPQDRELTKKIIKACKLIDVVILDHVIITPHDGYFSFADFGYI